MPVFQKFVIYCRQLCVTISPLYFQELVKLLYYNTKAEGQVAVISGNQMDAERISKQSKGNVDQSLLEGTGSGGMLSAGYFNDNSLIDRLHDGERVDYALQNLTKGITSGNGDSDDTISPHSELSDSPARN